MIATSSALKQRELVKFLLCLGIHGEALQREMRCHENFKGKGCFKLVTLETLGCFYYADILLANGRQIERSVLGRRT